MPITFLGLLEDVDCFEGKNGFGANVTVSTKQERKTKRISFMVRDREQATKLETLLDSNVQIKIELSQNNFGLRFGDILDIKKAA